MLPWYHLHSNVKTFLIRPITGSSVVSYCSLSGSETLFGSYLLPLPCQNTFQPMGVSLCGGLLHTPLPHYIITDNFSENGGGCQGVSGFSVDRQHRNYFMFCGRFRYDKDAEVSACTERKLFCRITEVAKYHPQTTGIFLSIFNIWFFSHARR